MSGDPEQEYFTDGMVEDIITALSRFKSLFIIALRGDYVLSPNIGDQPLGSLTLTSLTLAAILAVITVFLLRR